MDSPLKVQCMAERSGSPRMRCSQFAKKGSRFCIAHDKMHQVKVWVEPKDPITPLPRSVAGTPRNNRRAEVQETIALKKEAASTGVTLDDDLEDIYRKILTPGERVLWPKIKCGDLENDIRMIRIYLRRAYKAQEEWERSQRIQAEEERLEIERMADNEAKLKKYIEEGGVIREGDFPVETINRTQNQGIDRNGPYANTSRSVARKRTNHVELIVNLNRLLVQMETAQLTIMQANQSDKFFGDMTQKFRDFADAAFDASRPKPPPPPAASASKGEGIRDAGVEEEEEGEDIAGVGNDA